MCVHGCAWIRACVRVRVRACYRLMYRKFDLANEDPPDVAGNIDH